MDKKVLVGLKTQNVQHITVFITKQLLVSDQMKVVYSVVVVSQLSHS